MPIALAQNDLIIQIAPWLGVLVLFAVVGGMIMAAARRYSTNKSPSGGPGGFTLADLRRLREKGEMNQSQYERAKEALMKSPQVTGQGHPIPSSKANPNSSKRRPNQQRPGSPAM